MSQYNFDKIGKEIDKCETVEEIIDIYQSTKDYCYQKLVEAQKALEEKSNTVQLQINKINGEK